MEKIRFILDFFRMFLSPIRIKDESTDKQPYKYYAQHNKSVSIHFYSPLSINTPIAKNNAKAIIPNATFQRLTSGETKGVAIATAKIILLQSKIVFAKFLRCSLFNFIGSIISQMKKFVKKFLLILLLITLSTYQPIYCLYAQQIDVKTKIKELKSKDPKVRAQAVDVLEKHKKKEAVGEIVKALKVEKDATVRIHIVHSLGSIGDKTATVDLIKTAKEDKSRDVRAISCLSLGLLKDSSSLPTLKEILLNEKENENVRVSAGSALILFFIEQPKVKEVLEVALFSKNRLVKLGLVDNLRHIARKIEGKYLLDIAKTDRDEEVKNLAMKIIQENE